MADPTSGDTPSADPQPADPGAEALRHSPLATQHRRLDAKMTPFGGWEMPLQYPSGTLAEHMACRTSAVAFDVSHLGTVRVVGPDAFEQLQFALTNDLSKIEVGKAQYTHLLSDTGGVLDDIIVWWVGPADFHVMPNASNTERVRAAVGGDDITESRAVIAVQGPGARAAVRQLDPALAEVGRFRVGSVMLGGIAVLVAGTGYTGEDGIEIAVPAGRPAELVWEALLEVGVMPAGLGARDTLRLEAGLPLHGHELGPDLSPLEAGLGWVVGWKKADFRGRAALVEQRDDGPARQLVGLRTQGRQPPRAGYRVVDTAGAALGEVTSGNFSPVLEVGIAMAFVAPHVAVGDEVAIEGRGRAVSAEVCSLPFVSRG